LQMKNARRVPSPKGPLKKLIYIGFTETKKALTGLLRKERRNNAVSGNRSLPRAITAD